MTQLSIKVTGGELVRQGLQDLAAEIPQIGRLQIYQTQQAVARRLKSYWTNNNPMELPSYTRTGTLARGYQISPLRDVGYTLSNSTPYTKHVVGDAYGLSQAWMHAKPGRHTLWRDVQDDEVDKLPQEIDDAITVVARRKGF